MKEQDHGSPSCLLLAGRSLARRYDCTGFREITQERGKHKSRGACVNHTEAQDCRQKPGQQIRARVKLSRMTKTCTHSQVVTLKAIEEGKDYLYQQGGELEREGMCLWIMNLTQKYGLLRDKLLPHVLEPETGPTWDLRNLLEQNRLTPLVCQAAS